MPLFNGHSIAEEDKGFLPISLSPSLHLYTLPSPLLFSSNLAFSAKQNFADIESQWERESLIFCFCHCSKFNPANRRRTTEAATLCFNLREIFILGGFQFLLHCCWSRSKKKKPINFLLLFLCLEKCPRAFSDIHITISNLHVFVYMHCEGVGLAELLILGFLNWIFYRLNSQRFW